MTAPSAAQLPPPVRPLPSPPPRGPRSRLTRRLGGVATALLLASAATGCVTVHGATALVPSATRAAAAKALSHFVRVSNEADTELDPRMTAQAETGALGALDEADITMRHATRPGGDPGNRKLALHDTHFLIPRQRGWPKWFVVDSGENRNDNRYLLVFTHDSATQPWRASYLLQTSPAQAPDFATDQHGDALAVPMSGARLAVEPGRLGARYAAYLQHGDQGSAAFADGPSTTGTRTSRRTRFPQGSGVVTQFADEPADPARFGTVALRLTNGAAMVFFTTQFQVKETVANGPIAVHDKGVQALLTGTPNTSITDDYLAMQVVTDPVAGKVAFVYQIQNLVDARGQ